MIKYINWWSDTAKETIQRKETVETFVDVHNWSHTQPSEVREKDNANRTLEPQRCEDIKGIEARNKRGPKGFGTFEKQAPRTFYRCLQWPLNVLVFICFSLVYCFLIQTSQAGSHCKSIASSELNLSMNIKRVRVCSCFVSKYTHLLTVQWTRNVQYCTQLRFVLYWKILVIDCTVSACVYLKAKHSQQSRTRK